jgi:hypothetical protein
LAPASIATTGDVSVGGGLITPNIIAPTALAANTNNWNPTGLVTAAVIMLASNGAYDLTGLAVPYNGSRILLVNNSEYTITLKFNSGFSSSPNRFFMANGADIILRKYGAVEMVNAGNIWCILGA